MLGYEHSTSLDYIRQDILHSLPANFNTSCLLKRWYFPSYPLPLWAITHEIGVTRLCKTLNKTVYIHSSTSHTMKLNPAKKIWTQNERERQRQKAHVIHTSQKWLLSGYDETKIYPIPLAACTLQFIFLPYHQDISMQDTHELSFQF
jgi:hypothetical protein